MKTSLLGPRWRSLLVAFLVLLPTAAFGEYKLQPGDVLDFSVTGYPDLRQRAVIGLDGDVVLPIIGRLEIGGLPISGVKDKIVKQFSDKFYQQTTVDGREIQHLIIPNEIMVAIAEYRPIYVTGDVATPGERAFRPGMTVRDAIAVAGGYDLIRSRLQNPIQQALDSRSDFESLTAELATEQAHIWRLHTELGDQKIEKSGGSAPHSIELSGPAMQAESKELDARLADREKDKAYLKNAIAQANDQLSILADKQKKDQEANLADSDEFSKIRDLFQKGMTLSVRLSEARRAVLFSSDQLLQTIVEMSNITRQRDEFTRQLAKIDTQSRVDDLRELEDANLRLAQTTARLKSAGEKLKYSSLQSQLTRGLGSPPQITVYRTTEDGPKHLIADEDLALLPGDVVEVVLDTNMTQALLPTPPTR